MKYILIWFLLANDGSVASGSAEFESKAACEEAEKTVTTALESVWGANAADGQVRQIVSRCVPYSAD